jgi:hypothetical protein
LGLICRRKGRYLFCRVATLAEKFFSGGEVVTCLQKRRQAK